jgi:transcription-repair coupling factor (superfamily II helicase)
MNEPLKRVLDAAESLTLAGVPTGFLPLLAADLARAAHGKGVRAVVIAADEAAMRALAETVPLFAPEVEVLTLPGWDCLPYDRASPALRVMAERLATLSALQTKADKPQLLVTTASALYWNWYLLGEDTEAYAMLHDEIDANPVFTVPSLHLM